MNKIFLTLKNHMNMFDILKKIIIKYFVILIGLIVFVLYMWNRFFRERTSKNLPLTLDIVYLIILIYLCILFTYLIYHLIFPKKGNIIVESLVEFFFTPLKELDIFIKEIPIIKPYYFIGIKFVFEKVENMIINSNKFFYIFWLSPRLILLTALYVDVFMFNRFHYKYMVVLFGLLLFFNKYFMYSLKYYKTQVINNFNKEIENILTPYISGILPFEKNDDDVGLTMTLTFENFIEFQTKAIVYDNFEPNVITIFSTPLLKNQFWMYYFGYPDPTSQEYCDLYKTNNVENYDDFYYFILEKIQEYLVNVLESAKRISLAIEYYKKTNHDNKKIKLIKIFVYTNYLICWSYVLYISAKSYTISTNDIIFIFQTMFSFQFGFNEFSCLEIEEFVPYNHKIFIYDYITFFITNDFHQKWIAFFKPLIKMLFAYSIFSKYIKLQDKFDSKISK